MVDHNKMEHKECDALEVVHDAEEAVEVVHGVWVGDTWEEEVRDEGVEAREVGVEVCDEVLGGIVNAV